MNYINKYACLTKKYSQLCDKCKNKSNKKQKIYVKKQNSCHYMKRKIQKY